MNCPRCNLALRKTDYEGIEVDMCGECWGLWLDKGELGSILARREFQFSEAEKKSVLDIMQASKAGPKAPANCPLCGVVMERVQYDESVHLVLDRCSEHGSWLDTGEIKKVQALAEKSSTVHRILLEKLSPP